jgi:hypothetical protein
MGNGRSLGLGAWRVAGQDVVDDGVSIMVIELGHDNG